jgi:hypothetical protein
MGQGGLEVMATPIVLRLPPRHPADVGAVVVDVTGWDLQIAADPPILVAAVVMPTAARFPVVADLLVTRVGILSGGAQIGFTLSGGFDGEDYTISVYAASAGGRAKTWPVHVFVTISAGV